MPVRDPDSTAETLDVRTPHAVRLAAVVGAALTAALLGGVLAAPPAWASDCYQNGSGALVCDTGGGTTPPGGTGGGDPGGTSGGSGGGGGSGCQGALCVPAGVAYWQSGWEFFPWSASQPPNSYFGNNAASLMRPYYSSQSALKAAECGGAKSVNIDGTTVSLNVGFKWSYRVGLYSTLQVAQELGIGQGDIACVNIDAPKIITQKCYAYAEGSASGPFNQTGARLPGYTDRQIRQTTRYGQTRSGEACLQQTSVNVRIVQGTVHYGRYEAQIENVYDVWEFRQYPDDPYTRHVYGVAPGAIVPVRMRATGLIDRDRIQFRRWCGGTSMDWNDAGLTYTFADCEDDDGGYLCRNDRRPPHLNGRTPPGGPFETYADGNPNVGTWVLPEPVFDLPMRALVKDSTRFDLDPGSSPWLVGAANPNDSGQPFTVDPDVDTDQPTWLARLVATWQEAGVDGRTWTVTPTWHWTAEVQETFQAVVGFDPITDEPITETRTQWVPRDGTCTGQPLDVSVVRAFNRPGG